MNMIVDGKEMTYTEYTKLKHRREHEEFMRQRAQQEEALGLLRGIGEAYQVYRKFIQEHPHLAVELPEDLSANQKVYEQLRERLERADEAPRCMYIKADGIRCASPRMKAGELCYAHQRIARAKALQLKISNLEDANSVQLAVMDVVRALCEGQITEKRAAVMLYGLQTAASNVPRTTFHKTPGEMVVEETPAMREEEPEPPSIGTSEKYMYENLDPDIRRKFMELGDEVDRRWLAKLKAKEGKPVEGAELVIAGEVAGTPDGVRSETHLPQIHAEEREI